MLHKQTTLEKSSLWKNHLDPSPFSRRLCGSSNQRRHKGADLQTCCEQAGVLRPRPASAANLPRVLRALFFFHEPRLGSDAACFRRHKRPQMGHMTPVPRENARGFINDPIEILFYAHAAARLPAWEELKRLFDLCCLSPVQTIK